MRRSAAVAAAVVMLLVNSPAHAEEAPVTSTGVNLPVLSTTSRTNAGPSLARDIRSYRSSGRFAQDQARIADDARSYLDRWLTTCRTDPTCRPAAVFDIDDTLISSYDVYSRWGFAPTSSQVGAASTACAGQTVTPVARLLRTVVQSGVDVVLITGRSSAKRRATESCLARRGITGWTALVMRATGQRSATAASYKSAERARLERDGYDIAFSIGDQFSDVTGGYLDHGFVLPNPMYAIP